jgi:uncharacterized protein YqgC (DUF456 family)
MDGWFGGHRTCLVNGQDMNLLDFHIAFQILIFLVMIGGLFSLFLVFFPGLVVIWGSAVVYGIVNGMSWYGWLIIAIITILMIFGNLADTLFMGGSARKKGASWWSIGTGILGGLLGSIFWPPLGGLLTGLGSFYLVEIIRMEGDFSKAWQSTRGVLSGCGWAVAARLFIGTIMIILWLTWVLIEYGFNFWVR